MHPYGDFLVTFHLYFWHIPFSLYKILKLSVWWCPVYILPITDECLINISYRRTLLSGYNQYLDLCLSNIPGAMCVTIKTCQMLALSFIEFLKFTFCYRPPSEGWGKVIVSVCSHFGGGGGLSKGKYFWHQGGPSLSKGKNFWHQIWLDTCSDWKKFFFVKGPPPP